MDFAHTHSQEGYIPDAGWKAASAGVWNAGRKLASRWCAGARAKGAKRCTSPAGTMAVRFCDETFAGQAAAAAFCRPRSKKKRKTRRRPPRPCYYWRRTWGRRRRRDILSPAVSSSSDRAHRSRKMRLRPSVRRPPLHSCTGQQREHSRRLPIFTLARVARIASQKHTHTLSRAAALNTAALPLSGKVPGLVALRPGLQMFGWRGFADMYVLSRSTTRAIRKIVAQC